jgi:hypothetical protein
MPITIPTFVTKESIVRPDLLAETPDPRTDVTHEEWNELVDLAVETAEAVNGAASGLPGTITVASAATLVLGTASPDLGGSGAQLGPGGLTSGGTGGGTDLSIAPGQASTGNPGKGLTLQAGVGAVDENGGSVTIDAGSSNGGPSVAGNVRIGRDNAVEVLIGRETVGSDITLEGDVDVLGDVLATGTVRETTPRAPITESTTGRTLIASDHGALILCTHASGCVITVPSGVLPEGFTCAVVQRGAGVVEIADDGGALNLAIAATFDDGGVAYTAEQQSMAVIALLSTTVALVTGDLAAA